MTSTPFPNFLSFGHDKFFCVLGYGLMGEMFALSATSAQRLRVDERPIHMQQVVVFVTNTYTRWQQLRHTSVGKQQSRGAYVSVGITASAQTTITGFRQKNQLYYQALFEYMFEVMEGICGKINYDLIMHFNRYEYEGWNFNFGNTPLDWIQALLE